MRILDVKVGPGRHWKIDAPAAAAPGSPPAAAPAPSRTARIVEAPVLTVSDRLMMVWIGLVGLAVVMATGGGRGDTDTRVVGPAVEASRAPGDAALIAQLRRLQPVPVADARPAPSLPRPDVRGITPLPQVDVGLESPSAPADRRLTVTVAGEVHQPGPLRVEPGTAVLPALMQAGGTTATGSLRRVDLARGGAVRRLDLYDGLIDGPDASLVLQDGDEIRVPPAGASVTIGGHVKRSGTLELAPGDTIARLIAFAGHEGKIKRVELARGDAKKARVVAKGPLEGTRWPALQDGDRIRVE